MKIALILALAAFGTVAALASAPGDQTKPMEPAAPAAPAKAAEPAKAVEADHIQVQHVLIAFTGTSASKQPRTQDEAKKLAYEILDRARKGEDFDALVKQYSEDQYPGIYGMSNNGVAPAPGEFPRNRMVPAFGNTGFPLKVGEVGIADFDQKNSPFGYHIVKRLK